MKDLPNVEAMRCEPVEPCHPVGLTVGSVTFGPNKDAPCYDPALVLAQSEVERLREGNRKLLDTMAAAKRWYRDEYKPADGADVVYPWED